MVLTTGRSADTIGDVARETLTNTRPVNRGQAQADEDLHRRDDVPGA